MRAMIIKRNEEIKINRHNSTTVAAAAAALIVTNSKHMEIMNTSISSIQWLNHNRDTLRVIIKRKQCLCNQFVWR